MYVQIMVPKIMSNIGKILQVMSSFKQKKKKESYSCRADKDSYPHDGRADKGRYQHDSRADKNPYQHDRRADSLSLRCTPPT